MTLALQFALIPTGLYTVIEAMAKLLGLPVNDAL